MHHMNAPVAGRVNKFSAHLRTAPTRADALDDVASIVPELEAAPVGGAAEQDGLGLVVRSRWARKHLRWMSRKDALGQDILLLGEHGPLRRRLALEWCATRRRAAEYVALTADTTEAVEQVRFSAKSEQGPLPHIASSAPM